MKLDAQQDELIVFIVHPIFFDSEILGIKKLIINWQIFLLCVEKLTQKTTNNPQYEKCY